MHGFDKDNKEIIETVTVDGWSKKLVNVDRILSVSEKFVLTSYADGRIIYWEYKEGFKSLKRRLKSV